MTREASSTFKMRPHDVTLSWKLYWFVFTAQASLKSPPTTYNTVQLTVQLTYAYGALIEHPVCNGAGRVVLLGFRRSSISCKYTSTLPI